MATGSGARRTGGEGAEAPVVGVVLSGCGYLDGAEIHEATLTLLALDRAGAKIVCMAPDVPQADVVDHRSQQPVPGATRNVLAEASRVARGDIRDIAEVQAHELDALVFPGGFGAAKNLCTFANDGPACSVNPDVERLVKGVHAAGKPLGFICIAPALGAKILGEHHPKLTIGSDIATARALEAMGAEHVQAPVDEAVVDERLKIASAPAYMLGPSIFPVARGIDKCVDAVLRMVEPT